MNAARGSLMNGLQGGRTIKAGHFGFRKSDKRESYGNFGQYYYLFRAAQANQTYRANQDAKQRVTGGITT